MRDNSLDLFEAGRLILGLCEVSFKYCARVGGITADDILRGNNLNITIIDAKLDHRSTVQWENPEADRLVISEVHGITRSIAQVPVGESRNSSIIEENLSYQSLFLCH